MVSTVCGRGTSIGNSSAAQNTSEGEGYHGYWQQSLYELNSHFGVASDLQALATALHTRGMYLMVDVVVNHFGWPGNSTTVDYGTFSPFNQQSDFHPYCPITQDDYKNNQFAVQSVGLSLVDIGACLLTYSSAGSETGRINHANLGSRRSFSLASSHSLMLTQRILLLSIHINPGSSLS